ncbi:SusD/RagB family nutrient-binding outer membrane lipoprotein [Niabella beijingensis]|uniref:SusD/RagB family nutrient-binding outer membrane lipoprotein n=1 Tax=Niabella beijingensis TaxID=2872700 RepID=UPI001CBCE610|nr:SusD/RagB family nutrient-binding outer membrane lipoprotein [Niabella beijingensis]MBZ4188180.1 SusD/RagB family nutrient-binding outer membrane lipoprotein [Niabella beijingensis]
MKNLKYIILGCILIAGSTSCKKWLDVNTDPDNPNSANISVQNRLPWIQHFYTYTAGVTNFRTACQAGVYYSTTASANTLSTTWTASSGNVTPYQTWFVEVSSNIHDMYIAAEKKGAYHYMAAANVFSALGFMQMLDVYGEMPYTQTHAISGVAVPSPAYDDGKTIYNGCMTKLNEAISLFSRAQEAGAPSFSSGDMWNGGDAGKWIKLCYGLKARYMLKLSKKANLFNPDSILYCLSKGPQSNADNIVQPCYNNSTELDYLLGDPVVTNGNWDYAGYGSNQRITHYYYNLLTNMRNEGITDPRMTKIVPASMANVKLDKNGKATSYTWNRSIGVDSYGPSDRLKKGGPASIVTVSYATDTTDIKYAIEKASERADFIAAQVQAGRAYTVNGNDVTVTYPAGSIYINSTNYLYAGDTDYVNLRSFSIATGGLSEKDLNWYPSADANAAGVVGSTGSFQIRPVSDQEILTYHEMCFIKAETYMWKGDQANAQIAYKEGIRAHLNMMQAKLTEWKAGGYDNNPDMWPMDQNAIDAYLQSAAVSQSAGTLTMADIMLQKYIAMGCSVENWNDMRRFNFSTGNVGGFGVVYPGYDRGPLFAGTALYTGGSKTDPRYWQRRWMLPGTLELNYNSANALAMNRHAADPNIWSMPVWWDCATDDEYYGYLK